MIDYLVDIPKQKLSNVMTILNSRRLLSDHSEVLEECLIDIDENSQSASLGKYLTVTNCSMFMASTLLTSKFLSKRLGIILGITCSAYTTAYFSKVVFDRQLWNLQKAVRTLLDDIDRFDACTRRNIAYFRENALFQTSQLSAADNIATSPTELTSCVKSLIAVIESIYNAVKSLETVNVPKKIENIFHPLENLSECEYLQMSPNKSSVSNLKDLYNIFLYVQSHLLTQIGLFLICSSKDSLFIPKKECSLLSGIIRTEISNDNQRYEQLISTSTMENSNPHTIDHITTEPISNLKNYSMSVSSRMLAIASQCRHIDSMIQSVHNLSKDELIRLMPSIVQIENSICVCQNDYQRFIVAYHKLMYVKYNVKCPEDQTANVEHEFTEESPILNFKPLNQIEAEDEEEFFTSTDRTSDDETKDLKRNRRCWDEELTTRNFNIVKQRFKPVLDQLKGKIEPIALSLRERERNHLLSKGIDPSEFVDCNNIGKDVDSGSDANDSETEHVKLKKPNRTYDDMRKFLEGKPQISLIPIRSANESFMSEDILE